MARKVGSKDKRKRKPRYNSLTSTALGFGVTAPLWGTLGGAGIGGLIEVNRQRNAARKIQKNIKKDVDKRAGAVYNDIYNALVEGSGTHPEVQEMAREAAERGRRDFLENSATMASSGSLRAGMGAGRGLGRGQRAVSIGAAIGLAAGIGTGAATMQYIKQDIAKRRREMLAKKKALRERK